MMISINDIQILPRIFIYDIVSLYMFNSILQLLI